MSGPYRLRAVVLSYGQADLTLRCVGSLTRQHLNGPLDIVVVDNASPGDDALTLRARLPRGVSLVISPQNLGYAAGNNIGIRWSGAPRPNAVLVVNNDVELVDEETCAKLVLALTACPERAAVSPLVDTVEAGPRAEEQIQVRRVPGFWTLLVTGSGWLRRLPGLRRRAFLFTYGDQRPYQPGGVYDCETINGSCFLVRTDFLEEIGFLDEGTFLYFEELILGRQMLDRGHIAALTAATRVIHQQGRSTGHGGKRVRLAMLREMVRSEVHYCRKYLNCGAAQILLLYLVRAVDIASKMALVAVKRVGWALRGAH
jgi:GT2 family glycosyltransferase